MGGKWREVEESKKVCRLGKAGHPKSRAGLGLFFLTRFGFRALFLAGFGSGK